MLNKLLKLDWILIVSIFLLLGIGLISLYGASLTEQTGGLSVFTRQCIFSVIGITVMFFLAFSDYHYLRSYSLAVYFAMAILLLAVLIWGNTVRGTAGWISIGNFHMQPVELAKIGIIIFLASFISQKKMELGEIGRLVASFILVSIIIFLVLRQPDFGSAMVLLGVWLGIMLVSGISKKNFLALIIVVLAIAAIAWFGFADYQKARIINLIEPGIDPRGSGYNVIQSMVAVGSGGFIGKGIGHGTQSQLNFLPEKNNDFIFAMVTEEIGLSGSLFVIILFLIVFYRIKQAASQAPDNFGYLLAAGALIMYFIQVVVNIGMNIGIVPVTGIPLPFLSYGGSFLITVFATAGIILNIGTKKKFNS